MAVPEAVERRAGGAARLRAARAARTPAGADMMVVGLWWEGGNVLGTSVVWRCLRGREGRKCLWGERKVVEAREWRVLYVYVGV